MGFVNSDEGDGDAPPVAMATPDQPVSGADRLVTLDYIRGFAVLGILFANIGLFAGPTLAYSFPAIELGSPSVAEQIVWLFQFTFVDGKMRGLFTLLFGAGLMLFMQRAWARGAGAGLQVRRLLLLTGFGLIHFFFLFSGDILYLYSLAGLLALTMVHWPAAKMIRIGLLWYVVGGIVLSALTGNLAYVEQTAGPSSPFNDDYAEMQEDRVESVEKGQREIAAFSSPRFADQLDYVVEERSSMLIQFPIFALLETVPLMLLGMGLFRKGFFSGGLAVEAMRKWGWIGYGCGALLTASLGLMLMARQFPPYLSEFITSGLSHFLQLPMILGLASLLVLAAPTAASGWLGERLVPAGRMAFSNYIGTSIVMMLVFRHSAGGNYMELDRVERLVAVALGCALMLAWSKPWLARFRYGPLEWLWRCLTYGKLFPLRK